MRTFVRRALTGAMLVTIGGASGAACFRNTAGAPAQPATWLQVENRSTSDATVYVYRSAQRQRLGNVGGLSTELLRIPSSLIFGMTELRFQVDFLAAGRTPITESVQVSPGDTVVMQLPMQ